MNDPLPTILNQAWPGLAHIKQYTRSEWRAECPQCGEMGHTGKQPPDRFVMRYDGDKSRGWCRRCGYSQFAENVIRENAIPSLSPEELQAMAERARVARAREAQDLQARLSEFTTAQLWNELNRRMTEANRQWWVARGIARDWQDFWKLGYRADKAAYSIPYFDPDFHPVTIQYRLQHPDQPNDKYRWEYGLHSAAYITRPDMPLVGPVIICEGAIKAMVTHVLGTRGKMQVLAVPSKADFANVELLIERCGTVFVLLDPDARDRAHELAENVGRRARIVDLHGKVDDLILDYGLGPRELRMALKYSRPL